VGPAPAQAVAVKLVRPVDIAASIGRLARKCGDMQSGVPRVSSELIAGSELRKISQSRGESEGNRKSSERGGEAGPSAPRLSLSHGFIMRPYRIRE
jgi:hypothetical protein